jgi:hypothetical protein
MDLCVSNTSRVLFSSLCAMLNEALRRNTVIS